MSAELSWFKSSYSDDQGGECLEVAYTWRKSSHSGDFEDACVEVAAGPHTIHVRDSKLGARSPRFTVPAVAWTAFIAYAATGA
ncbi:DUF397 domain-containing protein [Streptomyces sp. FB2]|uniref:DUF397 domain-containing protein n=1 Tax=Streptomyces sp. FB2 TaxID=2902454 RepID=UPI001F23348D|nr:DUF397 domain-containing protein [Streptomyces sp. FB2]MCF2538161.1 DUF397 domain-containing protein [Streptomyces sp. FB2]